MIGDSISEKQVVHLENRSSLTINCVSDIVGFDEQEIRLKCKDSDLVIEGSGLRVNDFSSETGKVSVEGTVSGLYYTDAFSDNKTNGILSFFKRKEK